MPKKLHEALRKAAKKKGLRPGTTAYERYVHGGMQKAEKQLGIKKGIGYVPGHKRVGG